MRRSPLLVVYLTVFLDLLGFGIILPLLPYYAERFGATGLWIGALVTAYSATQLVGAPLLGRVSDRIGRRPVLLATLAGSAASLTLTGLANNLPLLLLGRALAGLFGGSIATAQAYVADVTAPDERAKYMGLLGASIGLGFVFGPAIGAGLSGFGFSAAAFAAAGLAVANFLFATVALPESRSADQRGTAHARPSLASLAAAPRQRSIGGVLGAIFLATLAFVGMETTFALFGQERFALGSAGLGLVFAYVGIVIVGVQGGLVGRLNARYGERRLATTGATIMGLALLGLTLVWSLGAALALLGLLALGQGLTSPTLSSLLSRASAADEQGGTLGVGQSLAAAARAVGPIVAGWLYDRGDALPYVAGALLVLLAAWLVSRAAWPARGAVA